VEPVESGVRSELIRTVRHGPPRRNHLRYNRGSAGATRRRSVGGSGKRARGRRGQASQRCANRILLDFGDKANAQRLSSIYFFGGEKHLQGASFADEAREALGSAPAGDQSQGRTAMSENRLGRGNAGMARERKIEPASHAITTNRGEHRRREIFDLMR